MLADVQVVVEAVSRSQLALPDVAMCWLNSYTADLLLPASGIRPSCGTDKLKIRGTAFWAESF